MKCVLFIAVMLAAVDVVGVQAITTPADAFDADKDFANTSEDVVEGRINGAAGSDMLPHYSTAAPETANFQEGHNPISEAGTNKQIQCETYKTLNASQQQECDTVSFMSKNPTQRPRFTIDKQAGPILTGSKGVISNLGSIPGASMQQCYVEHVKNPTAYITETCMEMQTLENLSCKRMPKVACDPKRDGCDQDGIVPNSQVGDMVTSFTPDGTDSYILQFDTITDNHWGGWSTVHDHNLIFDTHGVGLITRFALIRATFDGWLMIEMDGNLIYVDPYGGDRLEVYPPSPVFESSNMCSYARTQDDWGSGQRCFDTGGDNWRGGDGGGDTVFYQSCTAVDGGWSCTTSDYRTSMVQYCATCFNGPELSASWSFGLNINVKSYLKNSSNAIFMWTIVAGGGEGAIQFATHQLYSRNCYDQWDSSQCASLEQRA